MNRLHGTKDFWTGALRTEGPAFRTAVSAADPHAPVPSCPDWTATDLVRHLGSIYAWVRGHVVRGSVEPPTTGRQRDGLPGDAEAVDWWQREFDELMTVLDGLDPELPAWNWAPQTKTAVFWHRRMAHETTVHRWDAQTAVASVEPVEAKVAADGVSEVLDTWLPAGRRVARTPAYGVVHLIATDVEHEWFVRLRGEGIALLDTDTLLDTNDHHTRARAVGTASDLLLGLWGRVPFEVGEVAGDATLLDALRVG